VARYERSIFIARPTAEVFAYMDDIEREREWQPQLLEAEQTPPGPTAIGTHKQYVSEFMGKRLRNTYVVCVYVPNQRVVCETTKDSVLAATSDVRWHDEEGGTRLTMTLEGSPSGSLRFLPAAMLERALAKEVNGALDRLKERLEAGR
jgi:carbon monoxide dehydrogenase subunit G